MTNQHLPNGWITLTAPSFDHTNVFIVEEYMPPCQWMQCVCMYVGTIDGDQAYFDECVNQFGFLGEQIEQSLICNLTSMAQYFLEYIVMNPSLHILLYSDVTACEFSIYANLWKLHLELNDGREGALRNLVYAYANTPHQISLNNTLYQYTELLRRLNY